MKDYTGRASDLQPLRAQRFIFLVGSWPVSRLKERRNIWQEVRVDAVSTMATSTMCRHCIVVEESMRRLRRLEASLVSG